MGACKIVRLIQSEDKTGNIFMLPLRNPHDESLLTCEMHNDMTMTSIMLMFTKWAFDWASYERDCTTIVSGMRLLEHGCGAMECLLSVIWLLRMTMATVFRVSILIPNWLRRFYIPKMYNNNIFYFWKIKNMEVLWPHKNINCLHEDWQLTQ